MDCDFYTCYHLCIGYKEGNGTVYAYFVLDDTKVPQKYPARDEVDVDDCSTEYSEYDSDSEEFQPSIPCYFHFHARHDCPQCITSYDHLHKHNYETRLLATYDTTVLYQKNAWTCTKDEVEKYMDFLKKHSIPLDNLTFVEKSGHIAHKE